MHRRQRYRGGNRVDRAYFHIQLRELRIYSNQTWNADCWISGKTDLEMYALYFVCVQFEWGGCVLLFGCNNTYLWDVTIYLPLPNKAHAGELHFFRRLHSSIGTDWTLIWKCDAFLNNAVNNSWGTQDFCGTFLKIWKYFCNCVGIEPIIMSHCCPTLKQFWEKCKAVMSPHKTLGRHL